MHIQSRAKPQKSPADLAAFVRVLSAPAVEGRLPINIEGVTGTNLELGGDFVFTVADGREDDARDWLELEDYTVTQTTDLYSEEITGNQSGQLLDVIERARESDVGRGRAIYEILIGAVTGETDKFYAQVTFKATPADPDATT